ncbi:MAG: ABC transporter ATP-binding protein [Saprospiraceae bacterium]|nr:ABC transporter ATP-binding protein [Candidatus Opimibacter skivensis]
MNTAAIIIEHVSKTYQRGKVRRGDIRSSMNSWWSGMGKEKEEFDALKDINLTIQQGDVVGIIGPNGAGKSTLLKLLSRITFPSKGRITIHGTLSSMLEVGTGFHPELTGRENIFLNGAIIGMKREEVARKLDSIVAFSGLEDFLDTPVKHYSSGMYVRLAFSVASHLEPDILLIDEVLAVGDQEFRKQCMDKMLDVSNQGRTIIMVSHQMSYLKDLCRTGVYLHAGSVLFQGNIDDTINHYVHHYKETKRTSIRDRSDRRGAGAVTLAGIEVMDQNGYPLHLLSAGSPVSIRLQLDLQVAIAYDVVIQLEFLDIYGQLCFVANNSMSNHSIPKLDASQAVECLVPKFPLNTGTYFINTAIYVSNQLSDEVLNAIDVEVAPGLFYGTGKLPPPHKGLLVEYNWK